MSGLAKYLTFRLLGHACVLVPVIAETLSVLPYSESDTFLDRVKVTGAAAVIIGIVVLCLLKNVLKERIKSPAPWMLACTSFLFVAASRVVADKLFYITLAWALGSLASLIPYAVAKRIEDGFDTSE